MKRKLTHTDDTVKIFQQGLSQHSGVNKYKAIPSYFSLQIMMGHSTYFAATQKKR